MPADQTEHGLGGLWLTVSEIAKRQNLSKSTVSEKVKALVAAGKLTTQPGTGNRKLVNLAAFLDAIGKTGDAIKELAAEARDADPIDIPPAVPGEPTLRDAQTRRAQFEADLKEIELGRALGELVPVAEVEEAQQRAAEAIVRVLDRLPTYADEIAAAVGKDGPHGARAKLKEIARALRTAVAEALTALAQAPPPDEQPAAPAPIADAESGRET